MAAAAARRYHAVEALAVEHRADAIAVARQKPRYHGDELDRQRLLLHLLGAEVHRGTQIEQKPRGHLAIFVILAYVRRRQTRRDVPVDVADIIVILILAQVGEIESETAKQR